MNQPETRLSLIDRIRDPADDDAWHEFTEIYRPIIVRMARAKGLQDADADDLAQQVLFAVSGAIERWRPNAKFRTWLRRITENAILNSLTRGKPDVASGDAEMQRLLNQQPHRNGPDSNLLRVEYRREILNWAARQIRDEFSDTTWEAFWKTAVENRPANEVARQLGRSRGGVYAARCRVMRRLVEKVGEFEEN